MILLLQIEFPSNRLLHLPTNRIIPPPPHITSLNVSVTFCNIHRQQLDSDMGLYKARTSVCLELDGAIAKTLWRLAFLCTVLRRTIKFTYQNRMITTIFGHSAFGLIGY